jgi:thioredoxin 1
MAVIDITDAQFEKEVIKSETPVLVDFWAPWCGPCKMASPVLDELAGVYENKVRIVKINVDEQQDHARELGVMSIPTTVLFKDGKEIGRQVGFSGKATFEDLLKKAL